MGGLMFGQHDDQLQNHDASQPTSDVTLANDNQAAGTPVLNVNDLSNDTIDDSTLVTNPSIITEPAIPAPLPATPQPTASITPSTEQLLDIKQQALQQLTPLVGHLEQEPEEKFRTTMMMIQASDNDRLVKAAYDAALQIADEKVRAQALLDIVNEINYFTHNSSNNQAV